MGRFLRVPFDIQPIGDARVSKVSRRWPSLSHGDLTDEGSNKWRREDTAYCLSLA
jgi:hypothetical protein